MKKPTNQLQEVLFELLQKKSIDRMSIMKNTGILNVTARIAELRNKYGVPVKCEKYKLLNKHGRPISYGIWSLTNKNEANTIYNNLTKNN